MKIKGTKTEYIDVEIDPREVIDKMKERWLWIVKKGDYINHRGYWEETHHTSHSWDEETEPATEQEKIINEAFRVLRELAAVKEIR